MSRLMLVAENPKLSVVMECEECGFEIPVTVEALDDEPEYVQCSRCWAVEALTYRLRKLKERHTPDPNEPSPPPMEHIDTRDLPGFVRDDAAKNIGKTLSLFK